MDRRTFLALMFAPTPLPRRHRTRSLSEVLPGRWVMRWGGSPFLTTLWADGRYECRLGSLHYVGSWTADDSRRLFRITESSRPEDASSWQSYCVQMDDDALTGKVQGSGIQVTLVRE